MSDDDDICAPTFVCYSDSEVQMQRGKWNPLGPSSTQAEALKKHIEKEVGARLTLS